MEQVKVAGPPRDTLSHSCQPGPRSGDGARRGSAVNVSEQVHFYATREIETSLDGRVYTNSMIQADHFEALSILQYILYKQKL